MIKRARNFLIENKEEIFAVLVLSFITLIILSTLDFGKAFQNTIPEGGDYLFHYAKSAHMKYYSSPWDIRSWTDLNYGGFSLFHFYAPLVFIFIQLISFIIPLTIAFKVTAFLGLILLPLTLYICIRILRDDYSAILAPVLILPFLFHNNHFAFGGNFKSVVVGEFTYSLALLFLILFIFLFYKGISEKKYLFWNILLLFGICLIHPVPGIFAFFLPLFFLFKNFKENLPYLIKFYIISILLCCIWFLPYASLLKYAGFSQNVRNQGSYEFGWPLDSIFTIFPEPLFPLILAFVLVLAIGIFRKNIKFSEEEGLLFFGALISGSFFAFKLIGWPIRFLPIFYLCAILFLSLLIGRKFQEFRNSEKKLVKRIFNFPNTLIFLILIVLIFQISSSNLIQPVRSMASYQLNGQNGVPGWEDMNLVLNYLKQAPGNERVVGLSIKPETIYIVTGRGGVFGMFHYSLPSELAFTLKSDLEKPSRITQETISKMEIFNVKYVVVSQEEQVNAFQNSSSFELAKEFGEQKIFELKTNKNSFVEPLKNKPYLVSDLETWKSLSKNWVPLKNNESQRFIALSLDIGNKEKQRFSFENNSKLTSADYSSCSASEVYGINRIDIQTDCIDSPLLVKVSYFPAWKIKGADKIYLVSPGFMLVYPEKNQVTLTYEKLPIDWLGIFLFSLGILLLISLANNNTRDKLDSFAIFLVSLFSFFKLPFSFSSQNKRFHKIIFIVLPIIGILLVGAMANAYYKFPSDITDRYKLQKGKTLYLAGNNEKAISVFEEIESRKLEKDKFYYLSLIYFRTNNFEKAKENLFSFVSKDGNSERSAELRYNYILALSGMNQEKDFLHEVHMIDVSHPGSKWREKALAYFENWKKTHEYDSVDLI